MKISYIGKGLEVSDSLKARTEKKLGKMDRLFSKDAEATVRFSQQKGNRNIVELTVSAGGMIIRAEESSNDMYLSIDRAIDKLESQLRRYRTKLEDKWHKSEPEAAIEEEAPVFEEANYDVVRVKKFAVKPMSVEDAITQMELLGHDFYLFMNEETEIISVLYRRKDGSYGLLQPEI